MATRLIKSFGGRTVADAVSLTLAPGERRVVLGPNGAGKTTLFNLIAGTLRPEAGTIRLAGRDVTHLGAAKRARLGLARSYQRNNLFAGLTVRENLALAAATATGSTHSFTRALTREAAVREAVAQTAELIGLTDRLDMLADALAYGERRQLELGMALATRPTVLLLDEPTSGVGPERIETVHKVITGLPRTLACLIIEHDLDLGFALADTITVLSTGEVVFDGTPDEARNSQIVRDIYLGDWAAA